MAEPYVIAARIRDYADLLEQRRRAVIHDLPQAVIVHDLTIETTLRHLANALSHGTPPPL